MSSSARMLFSSCCDWLAACRLIWVGGAALPADLARRARGAGLPLAPGIDRRSMRLMLMGALNWAPFWFDPQGRDTPRALARKFVGLVKEKQDVETSA